MAMGSSAEDRLRLAVGKGEACDLGAIDAPSARDAHWEDREVPATAIVELLLASSAAGKRFDLCGARIVGRIDLRDCELARPAALKSCWLDGGLGLDFATIKELDLSGSRISASRPDEYAVAGQSMAVAGDMVLSGALIEGGVDFDRCTIGGLLAAVDATIHAQRDTSEPKWALALEGAQVAADVVLSDATVHGAVTLSGTKVDGQLSLRGSTMTSLHALPGCQLSCRPDAPPANAVIWAQRCEIGESVLAGVSLVTGNSSRFSGYFAFTGAHIKGGLSLGTSQFASSATKRDPNGAAEFGQQRQVISVDLYDAVIDGALNMKEMKFSGPSEVDLRYCTVGRLRIVEADWTGVKYGIAGLTYKVTDVSAACIAWIRAADDDPVPRSLLEFAEIALAGGDSKVALKAKIEASHCVATPVDKALLRFVAYGYKPYMVAIPLLILAALTLVQTLHARQDDPIPAFASIVVGEKTFTPTHDCDDAQVRCLQPVIYALDAVLPIDLKQVSTWRPDADTERGQWLSWLLVADELAAWALAGVFIAAVGGYLART